MTNIYQHINIILICSSIVGLTFFCHFASDRDTSLPFLLPFLMAFAPLTKHAYMIRGLYCVIAFLSVLSVFVSHTLGSVLIASCSLGLSLNLGYYLTNQIRFFSSQLTVRIYEGAISLSIALGILLSIGASSLNFSLISGKILVLVATVANFYLPTGTPRLHQGHPNPLKSKVAFILVPFYMQEWTYSIGFAIGIYLNTFEILTPQKYGKYLVVCGLILIEMLTYRDEIQTISELMRAVLIYHFEKQTKQIEMVFVLAFILLRLQFTENQLNGYLALGYALLAIVLWRKEDRESNASGCNMNRKESTEIEMSLLNNLDKQTAAAPRKDSQENRDFND